MRRQNILATVLAAVCVIFLMPINAVAADNHQFSYDSVRGVQYQDLSVSREITSDNDFNYVLDKFDLYVNGSIGNIRMVFEGKPLEISFNLYQSQIGNSSSNRFVGVKTSISNDDFDIERLFLERNTQSVSLITPNLDLIGKSTISIGVRDDRQDISYFFQFALPDYILESAVACDDLSIIDISEIELSYYSLRSVAQIQEDFNQLPESSGELQFIENKMQNVSSDFSAEHEREAIDSAVTSQVSTYSLINDIPDSMYKIQENGTWSSHKTGFDGNGSANGYYIYHMCDFANGNVLNYVARYYITTITNNSGMYQDFTISFNMSHNVWVQYLKNTNELFISDDRASNGRIKIDPSISINVIDSPQYVGGSFLERQIYGVKNSSPINKFVKLIIGYVKGLGDAQKIYETINSPDATGTTGTVFFEQGYTKSAELFGDNLKYAPNGSGQPQDYIALYVKGLGVTSFEYKFSSTGHK